MSFVSVRAPKVVCGWKEEVARGKARGAITGEGGRVELEEMFRAEMGGVLHEINEPFKGSNCVQ